MYQLQWWKSDSGCVGGINWLQIPHHRRNTTPMCRETALFCYVKLICGNNFGDKHIWTANVSSMLYVGNRVKEWKRGELLRYWYEKQMKKYFCHEKFVPCNLEIFLHWGTLKGQMFITWDSPGAKLFWCLWQENLRGKDVLTKFHCMWKIQILTWSKGHSLYIYSKSVYSKHSPSRGANSSSTP